MMMLATIKEYRDIKIRVASCLALIKQSLLSETLLKLVVREVNGLTRKKLYRNIDYHLNKLIVDTTKLVVKSAFADCNLAESPYNVLIMPSLELLGTSLICVNPNELLDENLEDKLEKHRDELAEYTSNLDAFVLETQRILACLAPKASRLEMYRKRCKALGYIKRSKLNPRQRAKRI